MDFYSSLPHSPYQFFGVELKLRLKWDFQLKCHYLLEASPVLLTKSKINHPKSHVSLQYYYSFYLTGWLKYYSHELYSWKWRLDSNCLSLSPIMSCVVLGKFHKFSTEYALILWNDDGCEMVQDEPSATWQAPTVLPQGQKYTHTHTRRKNTDSPISFLFQVRCALSQADSRTQW